MPEPPDRDRPASRFRGARIIRPATPPPSRRARLAGFFSRTRVMVATGIAVTVGATGLLSSTLDLWGRARGDGDGGGGERPTGSVDIGVQTAGPGERLLWTGNPTRCDPAPAGAGPYLFLPDQSAADELATGPGEVGHDYAYGQSYSLYPLVHPDVIDVDPEGFGREQFVELGALVAGSKEIRVALANRTDEQLLVTDLTLDVERQPAPTGTIMQFPGGDPKTTYVIHFDLNEDAPVARVVDDECQYHEPFFARHAFAVDAGDSEVFGVEVTPGDCLCLVRLTVEYWHRGRWQTLTVPEAGADPIPVAAQSSGRYGMVYLDWTGWPVDGPVIEKHDCRREQFELCQAPAPDG